MAEIKALKPSVQRTAEQAEFVSFIRLLYEQAQSGDLRELHGVAVFCEEGEPNRLMFNVAGDQVMALSEISCDLSDLAEDVRAMRRDALDDDDDS